MASFFSDAVPAKASAYLRYQVRLRSRTSTLGDDNQDGRTISKGDLTLRVLGILPSYLNSKAIENLGFQ